MEDIHVTPLEIEYVYTKNILCIIQYVLITVSIVKGVYLSVATNNSEINNESCQNNNNNKNMNNTNNNKNNKCSNNDKVYIYLDELNRIFDADLRVLHTKLQEDIIYKDYYFWTIPKYLSHWIPRQIEIFSVQLWDFSNIINTTTGLGHQPT